MPNLMGETGDTMEDAIIFPIEETILPKSTNPDITVSTHTTLFFRYLKEEYQEDLVAKKLQILNAANKDYNFVVNDQYLELKRLMDDYRYDMDRWFLVAISILLLSGSGCMGMMVLFWDKRRHDIAVAIACGSTMKRIGAETIGELFLALMIGEFLGIGIVPLLENVVVYQEELYFNASGPIVVTVVAFGYSIISVWLGMRTLKEKDIALTLKEE